MELSAPKYYSKFQCVADRCTHSCCVGWEIDIDAATLAYYRSLPDELGAAICKGIAEDEAGAHFALCANGRCPNLDARGLCRIISALGEEALCDICREHPRFYHRVGNRLECGLGASCEEAARLILAEEDYASLLPVGDADGQQNEQAASDFDVIARRAAVFSILSDHSRSYEERLRLIEVHHAVPLKMDEERLRALLDSLEYLNEQHRAQLLDCCGEDSVPHGDAALACERFLAYLIYRHASKERTEAGFRLAVGVALVMERLFRCMLCRQGISCIESAVTVSEELEYSEDNTDAIRFALESELPGIESRPQA